MKIKNVTIDTTNMTVEEVDALIQDLRAIRARKNELRARYQNLCAMVENMKEDALVFCSRTTGEIFNPKDWIAYDVHSYSSYPENEEEE